MKEKQKENLMIACLLAGGMYFIIRSLVARPDITVFWALSIILTIAFIAYLVKLLFN